MSHAGWTPSRLGGVDRVHARHTVARRLNVDQALKGAGPLGSGLAPLTVPQKVSGRSLHNNNNNNSNNHNRFLHTGQYTGPCRHLDIHRCNFSTVGPISVGKSGTSIVQEARLCSPDCAPECVKRIPACWSIHRIYTSSAWVSSQQVYISNSVCHKRMLRCGSCGS